MDNKTVMQKLATTLLEIRKTGIEVDSKGLYFPSSEDGYTFIELALGLAILVMTEPEQCSICLKPRHDQYPHSATDVREDIAKRATLQERAYIVSKILAIANRVEGSNGATVLRELAELLDDDGAKRDTKVFK